jgi:N-methylhydantoinase A
VSSWHVGVDIGGTFTDVVAVELASGRTGHLKVPSSRSEPADGVLRGIAALADEFGVQPTTIRLLIHGTTLVTNAIIERRLAKTALVTTEGFRDVLEIGRHWREELYDPFLEQPDPLIPRQLRLEVVERLAADGEVVTALERAEIGRIVQRLHDADVDSVAVVLLHSYRNPIHEVALADVLRSQNGWSVCASSELAREIKEYERTATTVLNAALMPLVDAYLGRLETRLRDVSAGAMLFVTQSNGGALTPDRARERPVNLALSGPVGGVVAAAEVGRLAGAEHVIGFDMGGTSTDVSILVDGTPRFTSEMTVGDIPVRIPTVQVHSIGAGGGSIAEVDAGGALHVGPHSAGSEPGPACYGRGGSRPTVTDCQLVLGRLSEDFRLAGRLPLDTELARRAIHEHVASKLGIPVEEAAAGIIEVANAAMERAVRVALRDRGDDPRQFALVPFGGAGALHAVELARRLGIERVIVPAHPGTLSASGFLAADVRVDYASSELHRTGDDEALASISATFERLAGQAVDEVKADGRLDVERLTMIRSIDMRYAGQAYEVSVPVPGGEITAGTVAALEADFHARHERSYGFSSPDAVCEMVTFRLSAVVALEKPPAAVPEAGPEAVRTSTRDVYLPEAGFVATTLVDRSTLGPGAHVEGPAVIHQPDATTLVPVGVTGVVDTGANLLLDVSTPEEA